MRVHSQQAEWRRHGDSLPYVPTPFSRDQLSPEMQHRYGLDRRPIGRWIAAGLLVVVFVGALGFVARAITRAPVDGTLITWQAVAPDRVDVRIQVRRAQDVPVACVLRAQDFNHVDVGYATIEIPAGGTQVELPYSLRKIGRAHV